MAVVESPRGPNPPPQCPRFARSPTPVEVTPARPVHPRPGTPRHPLRPPIPPPPRERAPAVHVDLGPPRPHHRLAGVPRAHIDVREGAAVAVAGGLGAIAHEHDRTAVHEPAQLG